jgi:acetolactate synthase I/II/III large subunit
VLSGEASNNAKFYNQAIDQALFVVAAGGHYIAAHSVAHARPRARGFSVAQHERWPVVLGVPYDLQKLPYSAKSPYVPSARFIPAGSRPHPDPAQVAILVERIGSAECPVVLGGRGFLRSGAKAVPGLFARRGDTEVWNFQISDQATAPTACARPSPAGTE